MFDCLPEQAFAPLSSLSGSILLTTQRPSFSERYSFITWEPRSVLEGNINNLGLSQLTHFVENHKSNFIAGYLGYETGHLFEHLPPLKEKDTPLPHCYLAAYDNFLQYDHFTKKWWQWFNSTPPKVKLNTGSSIGNFEAKWLGTNQTKQTYLENIKKILNYIRQGDVYEVNYTQRCYFRYQGHPYVFFLQLIQSQPVAYAAFINTPSGTIISGSPELFLKVNKNQVLSKPMKGTRKRGRSLKEDIKLRKDLKRSLKDKAENLMIVDLMRNDLGKICVPGSVRVPKLFVVERYHTVFQMVSHITGILNPNIGLIDILKASFPPGSITGAPKKRAMEIINELEPHQRGVYTGVIGFCWQGKLVLSVAIRTIELFENKGVMGVGGGIVFDSDPEAEYEESLLKAKATMQALRITK